VTAVVTPVVAPVRTTVADVVAVARELPVATDLVQDVAATATGVVDALG
jgi:hypothetical protein